MVVLDGGEELKVLARNNLDAQILATPAIVDGKIYVRTEDHLYAFGLASSDRNPGGASRTSKQDLN